MEFIDDLGLGKDASVPSGAKKMFQGKIYSVWHWQQELYDGTFGTWEGLKRTGTAHTIGILPDEKILLTEDTQPGRGSVLTPPGGQIDEGEEPAATASREFLEETGYRIGRLVPWHYYRASTRMEWYIYAYIGHDLTKVGEPALEPGEQVAIRTFSFDEFLELGRMPGPTDERVCLRDRILRTILLEALLDTKKKEALRKTLYG